MLCRKINLYEGRDDVTLTTYVLDDSPEIQSGKKRPAVIVCPGGAYLGCSDREGEPVALRFSAMGYQAFVLRYSVYSENKGGMSFGSTGTEPVRKKWLEHPAPMRDIARAMLELRAHAEEWRVDSDKIAICGFSAGAHNCAMYSVYWDKPIIAEAFGADFSPIKPAACILGYTLSDYLFMEKNVEGVIDEFALQLFSMSNLALTGDPHPSGEILDMVSPARHVDENTPPMFLWATAGDRLVPVQHSTLMATALANAGIPFEMHIFESGDHGLSLADQTTSGNRTQMDGDAAKWMNLCDAWLQKRFALDMPDQPTW